MQVPLAFAPTECSSQTLNSCPGQYLLECSPLPVVAQRVLFALRRLQSHDFLFFFLHISCSPSSLCLTAFGEGDISKTKNEDTVIYCDYFMFMLMAFESRRRDIISILPVLLCINVTKKYLILHAADMLARSNTANYREYDTMGEVASMAFLKDSNPLATTPSAPLSKLYLPTSQLQQ